MSDFVPGCRNADAGTRSDGGPSAGAVSYPGRSPDRFFHVGSNTGFQCVIVGDTRGLGLGVAVMTNAVPGGRLLAWVIVSGVADLYAWPGWGDWGV